MVENKNEARNSGKILNAFRRRNEARNSGRIKCFQKKKRHRDLLNFDNGFPRGRLTNPDTLKLQNQVKVMNSRNFYFIILLNSIITRTSAFPKMSSHHAVTSLSYFVPTLKKNIDILKREITKNDTNF